MFIQLEANSKLKTSRFEYFTLAFNEGCHIWMDKHYGKPYNVYMDGFRYLGIDEFKYYIDTLKSLQLLRNDFNEGFDKDLYE